MVITKTPRSEVGHRFVGALEHLERANPADEDALDEAVHHLAGLFTDNAELVRHDLSVERGPEAAQRFWRDYRDTFAGVDSEFTRIIEAASLIVLEWTTEGALATGRTIRYAGVSLLDVEGDLVSNFATYYDSAAFLNAEHADAVAAR